MTFPHDRTELRTLLDRRFAGDLSAAEHVRLDGLAETEQEAHSKLQRAEALETLLQQTLKLSALGAPVPKSGAASAFAAAADLSTIDLWLAGESDTESAGSAVAEARAGDGSVCPASD